MNHRLPAVFLFVLASLLTVSGCQTSPGATANAAVRSPDTAAAGQDDADAAGRIADVPEKADFAAWVADFERRARREGIDEPTLAAAFDPVSYLPRIIELDRRQPEFTRQAWAYLDSAVSRARVERGRERLGEHRPAIDAASKRYGVPEEILVAIWGVESNFGSNFGSFSTIDALATLGHDGRRPEFARNELMAALRILQNGDIERERMRGSWAGAMGHTQFLPSSFEAYARDADGDGRRDIWGSIADVMASTAHYLDEAGWREGEPWGLEVRLPEGFDYARTELANREPSQAWADRGVAPMGGGKLPTLAEASVIAPAGAQGPAFLVGHNFRVIMRYNASTSYALAVGLLADRIAGKLGVQADWPRDEPALSRSQVEELQRLLNARGMEVGKPDGILGPNTRRGIREYQRRLGATPDGFATLDLLKRLRGDG